MSRSLLLIALLLGVACTPALNNPDDDDASGDDDDATGDDDDSTTDPGDDDDSTTDPGDDDDSTTDPGDDDDTPVLINPVQICDSPSAGDFTVLSWSISGDLLEATFEYGGGCEDHDFQLCWDGSFMESWPVQVSLVPKDWGPPDPCLALITETHTFDLQPLQDAWVQSYGTPPGEILVNMSQGSASYSF